MRKLALAIYRLRIPLGIVAVAVLLGNALVGLLISAQGAGAIRLAAVAIALATLALCAALAFLVPRRLPTSQSRVVESPVRGRWLGINSPASRVPSHGVRAYGQAYALDLVADPKSERSPQFGGPMMRPPHAYPAFGQPIFAMIDGEVVRASSWQRDHRARSNAWGFLYMAIEGMVREIAGPVFIVGNHATIRGDDGVYATVAHPQQGSIAVRVGDRVAAGTVIGRCGNSGNSSEPHAHAQLADRASLWTAQGLPMAFFDVVLEGAPSAAKTLPANEQHMNVA